MRFVINRILRLLGIVVISCLLVISGLLLLLHLFSPSLQNYKTDVEQYVTTMMAQPVKIGSLDVGVHNFEPVLSLHNSTIFTRDGKTALITVRELQVGIDLFGSLVQWHFVPGLLVVKGTNLSLQQMANGDVKILDLQAATRDLANSYEDKTGILQWLSTQGKVEFADLALTWQPYQAKALKFTGLDLVLTNRFSLHELELSGKVLQTSGTPGAFTAELKLHGDILEHQDLTLNGNITAQDLQLQLGGVGSSNVILAAIHDGDIELAGKNLALDFGKLFRKPIIANKLDALIFWQQSKGATQVKVSQFKVQNSQALLNGNFNLNLPQGTPSDPEIDLHAKFNLTDIPHVKDYFPLTVIPKETIAWLDNAFVNGTKVTGTLLLQGHLNKYPFGNNDGHFLVDSYIHNIDLHYQSGWPQIDNLYGKLVFENRSMRVNIDSANIMGLPTLPIIAVIPDLADPVLEVHGGVNTDSNNGLRFIAASPLRDSIGQELKGISLSGPMQLQLKLHIPLGEEISKHDVMHVDGTVTLQNNKLQLTDWNLTIPKFNGELQFTENSLRSHKLTAQLLQQPVDIQISTLGSATDDFVTAVQFRGNTSIADVQSTFGVKLNPYVTGAFNYMATLNLHHNRHIDNTLKIDSDLQGVAIDLPESFGKVANEQLPFSFTYYFGTSNTVREFIAYGDKLSAALSFTKLLHDGLKFVGGELKLNAKDATWQQLPGLMITGSMPKVDWSYWQEYLFKKVKLSTTTGIVRSVKIFIKELSALGQELTQVELQVTPQNSGQEWLIGLNNVNLQGSFVVPRVGVNKQIHGEFSRFHVTESGRKQFASIKPQTVPPLHFVINDFRYGDKNLGRVEFDTAPLLGAMQINSLRIATPDFLVQAAGKWSTIGKSEETTLSGKFGSRDIGALLRRLHLADSMIGGVTNINFALKWSGAPFEPALAKLNGMFSILVQRGRIINLGQKTEAELGFGRVLNLLSLQTLPRRLTLDFSDLLKSGFSFDTLKGNAELRNGDVYTNNVRLEGPAAQVLVKGRIGLVAKDYDILLATSPHVTSSIPIIATIAGGPIVGAASWLAEKVVGKAVGKATTYNYRITGSWEQPNVVKSN